jgi:aminoglycoside phosphotransferase (APT) family kinase protein
MTRHEAATLYADITGADLSDVVFYYVFGLFKIAVVGAQLFDRFQRGLTAEPRYAVLGKLVELIADHAEASIAKGSLE